MTGTTGPFSRTPSLTPSAMPPKRAAAAKVPSNKGIAPPKPAAAPKKSVPKKSTPAKKGTAAPAPPAADLKKRAAKIVAQLNKDFPDADCALTHQTPFQLLIATILSAQCTDERVNIVTKDLFKKYKQPADFAAAPQSELEEAVKSTGFYPQQGQEHQGLQHRTCRQARRQGSQGSRRPRRTGRRRSQDGQRRARHRLRHSHWGGGRHPRRSAKLAAGTDQHTPTP